MQAEDTQRQQRGGGASGRGGADAIDTSDVRIGTSGTCVCVCICVCICTCIGVIGDAAGAAQTGGLARRAAAGAE